MVSQSPWSVLCSGKCMHPIPKQPFRFGTILSRASRSELALIVVSPRCLTPCLAVGRVQHLILTGISRNHPSRLQPIVVVRGDHSQYLKAKRGACPANLNL
jgi:hypothetical protein